MAYLSALFEQLSTPFTNLFIHPEWRNLVDVAILTILIYNVIKLVMHTRSNSLLKGIGLLLVVAWLADVLRISALSWLLNQILSMGLLVIVIVFQPEMRRGLEQLGRSKLIRSFIGLNTRAKRPGDASHIVTEIVSAMLDMSEKRIGALIVIERNTRLGDIIETGTVVDAEISAPLIKNIFEPNTPLHDGAMIICNRRITAAACILQLTGNEVSRDLGTRHRAAIGITETTDAVSLIVSEETGIISIAREGNLTRHMDEQSLTVLLTELFKPQQSAFPLPISFRKEVDRK